MVRSWISPFALPALWLACLCAFVPGCPAIAQSADSAKHQRAVPAPVEAAPFASVATRQTPIYSVEFRSADQLSEQDRLLVADSESAIAERARFLGFEIQQNNWAYQQIVCPDFPNHLFLQYTRNEGEGDRTVFSASIPRNGNGRVRIIPILKRSYSLFSPAPINALTISAFNHIRVEEGESANADWLGNGLCYAALAGAHPRIRSSDAVPTIHNPIPALTAAMEILSENHGEEVIRFNDAAARPHPMKWTMTFTRRGTLLKATHKPASMLTASAVPQKSAASQTRPVPQAPQN
jgi:hypothetical protein